MNWNIRTGLFSVICGLLLYSCKKDKFITDPSAKLAFSTSSILYDTIFTTVGSVTRSFLVYNRNSQPINISSIRLAGGTASYFRINVDGSKGVSFADVEIKAGDSMFVFTEVTVDPNKSTNPLVIRDSILFETNGNRQDVDLEAWGQDAYFHTPDIFPADGFPGYSVIDCSTPWTNDKPHVIYAYALVPAGNTLTIDPGTRVYMHPNAVLYVDSGATLKVGGSMAQPVTFQGDRLEPAYAEAAGQWGWIHLSPLSESNVIDWAVIKNGYIGIIADTLTASPVPVLSISNTIIKNMSVAALYGRGSFIRGWNCVFANCGQYAAALSIGGRYNFYHCTFANYWSGRQFPVLLLNNYYKDANENIHPRPLDSAFFYNCIVYGDLSSGDEIKLDENTGAVFRYKFHNCLLKTTFSTASSAYLNVIVNKEPYFNYVKDNDYRIRNPLAFPAVIDKGDPAIGLMYPDDLRGRPRMANAPPDIGAYEYEP